MVKINKKKLGVYLFALMIVLLILYNLEWGGSEEEKAFAQCLRDNGAVFYGAYWCSHCIQQKSDLGNSKNIPYVECSLPNRAGQNDICNNAGIESYPTWEFSDGERLVGFLSKEVLSEKTGCIFNSD